MWLFVPSPCAPATVASNSDSVPLSSIADTNIVLPLTWNGKPMRLRSLRAAWKRAPWMRRLSGLTSQHLTLEHGVAQWIASLRDFHASHTATPAAAKESTTSVGSGPTSHELFASLERGSWCSKTSQVCFLPADSLPFCATWPKWGSLRNGECFRREAWEPAIGASGCSLSESSWMTPSVVASSGSEYTRDGGQKGMERLTIVGQAQAWPTPAARIAKGGGSAVTRPDGKSRMDMLDWAAESYLPQAPTTSAGPTSSPRAPTSRPRLNPAFVCWLMGLPAPWTNIEHTSFGAAEMELYHSRLLAQLSRCLGG